MKMNIKSLVVVALVGLGSAATATLAQKLGAENPPVVASEFVKIGYTYVRPSAISEVVYAGDSILVTIHGKGGRYETKDCVELLRVLRLPPPNPAKPGP
jgi:hypothetical protein